MRTLFLTILAATAVMLGGCASTAGGDITEGTWHLTSITSIHRQAIVPVEDMVNYTLTFNDDGTFDAKADCNQVGGTYTIVDASVLTMTLGPSTLAVCGEESLGDEYVQLLDDVKTYSIAEDQMTLTLEDSSELLYQTRT
jgi:heat shock protein HslJ